MANHARTFQVGVGLAAAWMLLAASGVCEPLERLTAKARYALRPLPAWDAPVMVVAIDETALAKVGGLPWSRRTYARLLERLHAGGAAVVGMDVAFNEPSRDPRDDQALAAAMRALPTVLPTFRAYDSGAAGSVALEQPIPSLAAAAVAMGSVQPTAYQQREVWELEPFQTQRGAGEVRAGVSDHGGATFPVLVAGAFKGAALAPPGGSWLWQATPLWLNYRGPARSVPLHSAAEILGPGPVPSDVRGRIVLLGATATGLPDTNFAVPDLRNGPMSGVEIWANAVDNLLGERFLRRLSLPVLGLLMLGLVALPGRRLLAEDVLGRRRAYEAVAAMALWTALAVAAFMQGVWLEVVPVLGFLFTCYFGGVLAERGALLRSRNQVLERYAQDLAAESRRQRERLEGELHDGVQQLLIALGRELRQARRNMFVPERLEARIERMEDISDQMLSEVQRVRRDLLPPVLRREGFEGAIAAFADELAGREGVGVAVERDGWRQLPPELEVELYWLVREAMTNAAKHAEAHMITVHLAQSATQAVVEVLDDGKGFVPPDVSVPPAGIEHSGLHRMWLRMRGRGGDLAILSRPGAGTTLRFMLPLEEPAGQRERAAERRSP